MHNKSWIADNQAAVIGGRNVGDEYFGAGQGTHMADLDLIGIGPVIGDLSRSFDAYWASGSSHLAGRILPGDTPLLRPETVEELVATHVANGYAATLISSTTTDATGYGRIVRAPSKEGDGRVLRIVEQRDATSEEREIREFNTSMYAFRRDLLAPAFRAISHANPFFYVISGFRYGFLGIADSPVLLGSMVILAIDVALGLLCYTLLKRGWKLRN